MDPKTTNELLQVLTDIDNEKDLSDYTDRYTDDPGFGSFSEYYQSQLSENEQPLTAIIRRSEINRTYFYQLFDGSRKPGRDKAIMMCLAAGFDFRQTRRALEIASLGILYSRNRRDAIILFAIGKGFSVTETNELLDKMGEAILE